MGDRVSRALSALRTFKLRNGRLAVDRRLLSLGIYQAWVFLTFHSAVVIPIGVVRYDAAYAIGAGTAVLALIAGLFLHYNRAIRVKVLVFATISGVVGTVSTYLLKAQPNLAVIVGPALVGIGVGLVLPFVGKVFSSADLKSVTAQTFGSYAFATAVYFLVLGMPELFGLVISALLPVALAVALLAPRPARPRHPASQSDEIRRMIKSRPIVMFFLGVGLVGVSFGFSLALAGVLGTPIFSTANQWGVLGTGILAIASALFFSTGDKGFNFETYFRPVVPLIIIGFLSMRLSLTLTGALIIAAFQLADMAIWVVLCWISSHAGLPQRVFCVGKGAAYLGMVIGSVAAGMVHPQHDSGSATETVATIFAYLLILAVVYVFNNSRVTLAIKTSPSMADGEYVARTLELKCQELGTRFDLTSREREILAYLAQGRTLPYIEAELCISHGTANSHRDHIYSKLGVHSRQDLLDLFEGGNAEKAAEQTANGHVAHPRETEGKQAAGSAAHS
ncbi:MAG: LuxR C-terminal-related transcriptional regulator [Coriobacteriia bacterium]